MRVIRVALCQFESHPALYTGHIAYPEEPFVPGPDGASLSRLGAKGIDVLALQEHCRVEYSRWNTARPPRGVPPSNRFLRWHVPGAGSQGHPRR